MPDLATIKQLADDVGAETALRLMGIFKTDAETRLQAVRDYLEGGLDGSVELKDLRIHAHSLKGLCLTYGAPDGAQAALELQDACDEGDLAVIEAKANALLAIAPDDVTATIRTAEELASS